MTRTTKPEFEIFLSSPGDVPQERDDAQAVVDEINASGEFSDMFTTIKLHRWDDSKVALPMPANNIPQKSVDIYMTRPSACDLVVVIFWSRMGSPLVMDEREYLSGTHYEYSEALGGYEQHGKPLVWLYRCQEKLQIDLDDNLRDKKIQQYDHVKTFFNQFVDEEGRFTGGVNGYPTHADFKALFKGQLITYLRHVRQNGTQPPPPPPPKIDVPYKGLRALREEDIPIFFGRTAESLDILTRVQNQRVVAVLGASGSGKSSLVMAGVLPKLKEQGWRIIQCVPSTNPFYELALAMVSQIPEWHVPATRYIPEAKELAQILRDDPENVVKQLRMVLKAQKIVLYIDQFEELFTIAEKADPAQVKPFIQAIRHQAQDITTILTMRADFYETALAHLDELKQEAYGLKKPSMFNLGEMITRPASEAGYMLDAGLAGRIIDDIGDDSGALALMAYVMETMYLRAKSRHDKHITHADYEALGGVKGAINTLAEKAYHELPFADKEAVLRNVFFHLIALTPDETGQLVATRRRCELTTFAPSSPEYDLITRFADARLLVKDTHTVEVAHEAILRHWGQLVAWIDANKGSMSVYRNFERDARVWADNPDSVPLPQHESLKYFHQALDALGIRWDALPEPLKSYTEPEATRLLRELDDINTSSPRRYSIGTRLSLIGDTRLGIGLLSNKIPDIQWCYVESGGKIVISNHTFTIRPFYISKYTVTNMQYNLFLETGYLDLELWGKALNIFDGEIPSYIRIHAPEYNYCPCIEVSWYESVVFSKWLDNIYREKKFFQKLGLNPNEWRIRLPTEWEWQWMGQNGDENRGVPWSKNRVLPENPDEDNFKHADINWFFSGINRTASVGMYPQNQAHCGALDVLGNVWEWCLNDYELITQINYQDSEKTVKGGSFLSDDVLISTRKGCYAMGKYNDVGFRVIIAPKVR